MKKNHGKTSMLSILTAIALLLGSFPGAVATAEEAAAAETVPGIYEEIQTEETAVTAATEEAVPDETEKNEETEAATAETSETPEQAEEAKTEADAETGEAAETPENAGEAGDPAAEESGQTETTDTEAGPDAAETEAESGNDPETTEETAESTDEATADETTGDESTIDETTGDETTDDETTEDETAGDVEFPDEETDEEEDEPVIIEDDDAGSIDEELLEPFNNPATYSQDEVIGTAEIVLVNEGMLSFGDEVTLRAKVQNFTMSYRLVWEANNGDERGWYEVGSGDEYRFRLERENVEREYRVVVIALS